MTPPRFWQTPRSAPGLLPRLLAPAAAIWEHRARQRIARAPLFRASVPVICVGNLTVGGAGKTPVVMALLERLAERAPHVVSRGYGGRLEGPVAVDIAGHDAADVGDEPLLLAALAPTWVAKARAWAVEAAEAAGAGVILMDDGFQNPDVAKTLSFLVVDAETGFGNGRIVPAGPLREALKPGLARADLLITLGPDRAQDALAATWPEIEGTPRLRAHLAPLAMGVPWQGRRVLAFAGIGRPEKFFATLRAEGAEVAATHSFGDHAPYSHQILERLSREAKALGAQLVTTEKDAARLPKAFRPSVQVLPVRLRSADWSPLEAALAPLF
ncbi:MAG: tetraacyldisaccharide 4'-kinase [Pseudomonadota bacterium]